MDKKIIKDEIFYCNRFVCRLIGNMFRKHIKPLLFDLGKGKYSNSIHTFFVFKPLDVYFLDKDLKVVDLEKNLKPFRIRIPKNWCYYILETPSGMFNINKGDILEFLNIMEA